LEAQQTFLKCGELIPSIAQNFTFFLRLLLGA